MANKFRTFAIGDWNLDLWKNKDYGEIRRATTLNSGILSLGYEIWSPGITWQRIKEGKLLSSSLDWLTTNQKLNILSINKLDVGCSDHCAVVADIGLFDNEGNVKENRYIQKRNFNRFKTAEFQNELNYKPRWTNFLNLDLDHMALVLQKNILEVFDLFAPVKSIPCKAIPRPKPSQTLVELRNERDKARKCGNQEEFKKLRNRCTNIVRRETIKNNAQRILANPNDVWKIMDEMHGKKEKPELKLIQDGFLIEKDKIPTEFNRFFINKVSKLSSQIPTTNGDPLQFAAARADGLNIGQDRFSFKEVSYQTVRRTILKMKKSSSLDLDGISTEMLKLCGESIVVPLTQIVNKSFMLGIFPSDWRHSRVIPIHKKKAKSNVENYRPVSLVKALSKIAEEIARSQLSEYLEHLRILPTEQHGFRKGRSTSSAVLSASNIWATALHNNKFTGALFFDLSSAFDMVEVSILVGKLRLYGVSDKSCSWIASYMSNRTQTVNVGVVYSEMESLKLGCPQGSGLSPLLFIILTSDMPEAVPAHLVMYADDTSAIVIADSLSKLNQELHNIAEKVLYYMDINKLVSNPEKTKLVIFNTGRTRSEQIVVNCRGSLITESPNETLLGLTLSCNCSWNDHIVSLLPELDKRIGVIRRLRYNLPKDVCVLLITPLVLSRIQYALDTYTDPTIGWCDGSFHAKDIKVLQKKLNEAARAALGLRLVDRVSLEDLMKQCF